MERDLSQGQLGAERRRPYSARKRAGRMLLTEWDEQDEALAARIFGLTHRDAVVRHLEGWLSDRQLVGARVIGLEISVGGVVEVELPDEAKLLCKIWPPTADPHRLRAQLRVQNDLARNNYPAPAVYSELDSVGDGWGVLMEFDRSGEPTDVRKSGVTVEMATGLAALVHSAKQLPSTNELPFHELPDLWPTPHNALFDFATTSPGAGWIDETARNALERLRSKPARHVAGHLDWSAKNMRVHGSTLAVVYDWDALFLADECFVVGAAAASFPTSWDPPVDGIATAEQMREFLTAYEAARGVKFTWDELDSIRASVSYSRSYTARCDHALDPQAARDRWWAVLRDE